jgi:fatty-acyl-CoA synthase
MPPPLCSKSHIQNHCAAYNFLGTPLFSAIERRRMPVEEALLSHSYSRGPARPLLEITIGDLLTRTATQFPDRLAVASMHQGKRLTWAELSAQADCIARGMYSLGIRRGDRVGIWSTNCIEWIMVHMGAARAGAALVNINPAYRTHELQFTLTRSRMKALFLWHKDKHADYGEVLDRARHDLSLELEHTIFFRFTRVARSAQC